MTRAPLVVRGARQHNLRGLDLDLPTDALVVVVGRSGSGKSSLAFDTLHAEGQRRYLEALSTHARTLVGSLPRPRVDVVHGLPPTVALSQDPPPPGRASTLGSLSEVEPVLRVLYGRAGVLHDPATGDAVVATPHDAIVDALLAQPAGARLTLEAPAGLATPGVIAEITRAGFSRVRLGDEVRRLDELRPASLDGTVAVRVVVDRLKVDPDQRARLHDAVRTTARAGGGVVVAVVDGAEHAFIDRPFSVATGQALPELRPALFVAPGPDPCPVCDGRGEVDGVDCATCGGLGLGSVARAVTVDGTRWPEVVGMRLDTLADRVARWPRDAVTTPLLDELSARVGALVEAGLGYLSLATHAPHLSSGEVQRVRIARQVGGDLTGVLYVLDEPTLGLDDAQVARLLGLLRRLRDRGNGVVVVEHHPDVLAAADVVVEIGPGPGREGGALLFVGPPSGLVGADTPTGRWLAGDRALVRQPRAPTGWWTLDGVRGGNLAGDPIRLAAGARTAVIGPSGAGKSSVIEALAAHLRGAVEEGAAAPADGVLGSAPPDSLSAIRRVLVVDEGAARRSRRSVPATYVGLWSVMRELFAATAEARTRAIDASMFSLNVGGGRCEGCAGLGVRTVDLGVLPSVDVPCETCEGRRFARDVLTVRWKGLDASEVLALCADEALPILAGHPRLEEPLRALQDVGLGYLPLGQPTHTLSGGEARRLRLARELVRAHRHGAADTAVLVDEPTAGLHPLDVVDLDRLLGRLADEGATVVVATHDRRLSAACDHVVELGPGAGPEGGQVVRQGPPG